MIGDCKGHVGQSLWLRELYHLESGNAPAVDLASERRNGEFARLMISMGLARAVHDISDGGLLVALGEMALISGVGINVDPYILDGPNNMEADLFGEDQGRYVIAIHNEDHERVLALAEDAEVPIVRVAGTDGDNFNIGDAPGYSGNFGNVTLADLREANERFFREWMEA